MGSKYPERRLAGRDGSGLSPAGLDIQRAFKLDAAGLVRRYLSVSSKQMRTLNPTFAAPLALVLLAILSPAQDVFSQGWSAANTGNLPDVKFELSAPKTTFYLGEIVPVNFRFTSSAPDKYRIAPDVCYRDQADIFVVEHRSNVGLHPAAGGGSCAGAVKGRACQHRSR
jgi:hypothetical protein